MRFLTNKISHIIFLLLILILAVNFSDSSHELRKRIQYLTFDVFNRMHERPATDDVVIVDIDEASLKQVGQWPWSRTVMAQLVENLTAMGAKSIAFDMVFAENDRTSPKTILKNMPDDDGQYDTIKQQLMMLPDNDVVFAQAIQKSGIVVTGFAGARPEETRRLPYLKREPTLFMKDKTPLYQNTISPIGLATNLPEFSSNAAGNGSFIATPHVDSIIREVSLFNAYPNYKILPDQTKLYPMLGLEAWRVSLSPNARYSIKKRPDVHKSLFDTDYYIKLGKTEIPVNKDMKFWVHYRDIVEDEYVPAKDVLSNLSHDKIKDKIILVGTSAVGLRDIRSTPLSIYEPGVEVHANVVEQILQNDFLTRPNFINGVEAIIILLAGLVIIILAPFINAVWLGLFSIGTITALFFGAFQAYVTKGLLFDPTYPSAVIFFLFLFSSLLSYLRAEADKRQVKTAFGRYISPDFMEELTKSPDKLKLGGEVKDLTVMFTDIRSFTKISEKLSPEELIQLMNDFLTPMSDLVMESRGTIDKYMGDAMMAFWNAPLNDPDHARNACITALEMNKALIPVNEAIKERAKEGGEPLLLSAGIGINTGPCSVGNMGSKQRFAYSALGDAVNLASRLEGQTKTYGLSILVGENTAKQVKDMALLELDLIKVIGREEPARIFTILGDEEYAESEEFKEWAQAHNLMLVAYRKADFDNAAKECKEIKAFANDEMKNFYDVYAARIAELNKNPPPTDENGDWDGVFIARNK